MSVKNRELSLHVGYTDVTNDVAVLNIQYTTNHSFCCCMWKDQLEHLDMFEGVVAKLLSEKWKTFARCR